nr:hypothetical protein HK105_004068 [Polyrhizophydium stewartii]
MSNTTNSVNTGSGQQAQRLAARVAELETEVAALRARNAELEAEHGAAGAGMQGSAAAGASSDDMPPGGSHWDRLPAELHREVFRRASPLFLLQSGRVRWITALSDDDQRLAWAEAFRSDWDGDLEMLLPRHTLWKCRDEDWLNIRTLGMLMRVADIAKEHDVDTGALNQVAMCNGWVHAIDRSRSDIAKDAMAAELGIDAIENLIALRILHKNRELVEAAAEYGRLDVVQWADKHVPAKFWTTKVMDKAALSGNADLVQWLHANRTEGCTAKAMDNAASSGNADLVKWLHANRTEGCTADAMDNAAGAGSIETLEFLHSQRNEGGGRFLFKKAIWNDQTEAFKWLLANISNYPHDECLVEAAEKDNIEILALLAPKCKHKAITKAAIGAAGRSSITALAWINQNMPSLVNNRVVAETHNTASLAWLHQHRRDLFTKPVVLEAIKKCVMGEYFPAVKWLRDAFPDVFGEHDASRLPREDANAAIDWLAENVPSTWEYYIDFVIEANHRDALAWLDENTYPSEDDAGTTEYALRELREQAQQH